MALFRCSQCGSVDNTGLTSYWIEKHAAFVANAPFAPKCSECETGAWHGKFPKRSAEGMFVSVKGFLHTREEILTSSPGGVGRLLGIIGPAGVILAAERPAPQKA